MDIHRGGLLHGRVTFQVKEMDNTGLNDGHKRLKDEHTNNVTKRILQVRVG